MGNLIAKITLNTIQNCDFTDAEEQQKSGSIWKWAVS
jgi:hypothetical protein